MSGPNAHRNLVDVDSRLGVDGASNTISRDFSSCKFNFLSSEDVCRIAAVNITHAEVFSELGDVLENGLHDLRMGGWRDCEDKACGTCKLSLVQGCVGHYGRVALTEQVYHPLLLGETLRLLKMHCRSCGSLRMHENEKLLLLQQFRYLSRGELIPGKYKRLYNQKQQDSTLRQGTNVLLKEIEAGSGWMDSNADSVPIRIEDHTGLARKFHNAKSDSSVDLSSMTHEIKKEEWQAPNVTQAKNFAEKLKNEVEKQNAIDLKSSQKRLKSLEDKKDVVQGTTDFHTALIDEWRSLIDYFNKNQPIGKCDNCGTKCDKYRKDGNSRVFVSRYGGNADGQNPERLLIPRHAQEYLSKLFKKRDNSCDSELMQYLYSGAKVLKEKTFFLKDLLITPNQFRAPKPSTMNEDVMMLNDETKCLKEIIVANDELKRLGERKAANNLALKNGTINTSNTNQPLTPKEASLENTALSKAFVHLQERVNVYIDASKGATKAEQESKGIKQGLEKKQGLFRMKMMGKRVNFAGRSVISPDPHLETNQIGCPEFMCKVLGFPEKVWSGNLALMERLVCNGNDTHPGASLLWVPKCADSGKYECINLGNLKPAQRLYYAQMLRNGVMRTKSRGMNSAGVNDAITQTSGPPTNLYSSSSGRYLPFIVYRHLTNNDPVLMNRQPTLHKPGIMTMLIRVLKNEKTLRFHYANCNTFNADFDGDEMNMHSLQDTNSRLEALHIAEANKQYIVPTSGRPLRGIIQDHIGGAALMMRRDSFFSKQEMLQLMYRGMLSQIEGVDVGKGDGHMVKFPDLNVLLKGIDNQNSTELAKMLELEKDKMCMTWPKKNSGSNPNSNASINNGKSHCKPLLIDPPAVLRPFPRWTGKQVTSMIIKNLTRLNNLNDNEERLIFHTSKPKTPGDMWNGVFDKNNEEGQIIIRNSELLTGVMDKSEFGASNFGLVHLAYELFGPKMAGDFLSCFARTFTAYLQMRGFSCCMHDTLVEKQANIDRKKQISTAYRKSFDVARKFIEENTSVVPHISRINVEESEYSLKSSLMNASRRRELLKLDYSFKGPGKEGKKRTSQSNVIIKSEPSESHSSPLSVKVQKRTRQSLSTATTATSASESNSNSNDSNSRLNSKLLSVLSNGSTLSSEALKNLILTNDGIDATLSIWHSVPRVEQLQLKQILHSNPILIDILEGKMLTFTRQSGSSTIQQVLPKGQKVKFPKNCFATMVYTGAKGSMINHSQIGCLLGQQELEGRRAPLLPTMRTLPSYSPYDLTARSGGYVSDRFLTGVRPQEFYIHCMAGREGLVDTTVKTSRSGYLQRCLVKHLENIKVEYDGTVRDSSDGSVLQWLYGEDGIDVTKGGYLYQFKELKENICNSDAGLEMTRRRYKEAGSTGGLDLENAWKHSKALEELEKTVDSSIKKSKTNGNGSSLNTSKIQQQLSDLETSLKSSSSSGQHCDPHILKKLESERKNLANCAQWNPTHRFEPTQHIFPPKQYLGSASEKFTKALNKYISDNKSKFEDNKDSDKSDNKSKLDMFKQFCYLRYQSSLTQPGEPVGVLAAQGMGEPSTQMTLNTFHLAGHGGANVTLGIPRLREIVQTASKSISTPLCRIEVICDEKGSKKLDDKLYYGQRLAGRYSKIKLKDLVQEYRVMERGRKVGGEWVRTYVVEIDFVEIKQICDKFPHLHSKEKLTDYLTIGQESLQMKVYREIQRYVRAADRASKKSTATTTQKQKNDISAADYGVSGMDMDDEEEGGNKGGNQASESADKSKKDTKGKVSKNQSGKKFTEDGESEDEGDESENESESSDSEGEAEREKQEKMKKSKTMVDLDDDNSDSDLDDDDLDMLSDDDLGNSGQSLLENLKKREKVEEKLLMKRRNIHLKLAQEMGNVTHSTKLVDENGDKIKNNLNQNPHFAALKLTQKLFMRLSLTEKKCLQHLGLTIGDTFFSSDYQNLKPSSEWDSAVKVNGSSVTKSQTSKNQKTAKRVTDYLLNNISTEEIRNNPTVPHLALGQWQEKKDDSDINMTNGKSTTKDSNSNSKVDTWILHCDITSQCCKTKILISEIIKKLLDEIYFQDERAKNIQKVNVLTGDKGEVTIETEGVNLRALRNLPEDLSLAAVGGGSGGNTLDYNKMYTNCISTRKEEYGIEAARAAIVQEIRNVFGHYGIEVNYRHLYLIADYMTLQGTYRAFSRRGMSNIASPFLQMTYETSMGFATKAALEGMSDKLTSASGAIISGKLPVSGTGAFGLMHDFKAEKQRKNEMNQNRTENHNQNQNLNFNSNFNTMNSMNLDNHTTDINNCMKLQERDDFFGENEGGGFGDDDVGINYFGEEGDENINEKEEEEQNTKKKSLFKRRLEGGGDSDSEDGSGEESD